MPKAFAGAVTLTVTNARAIINITALTNCFIKNSVQGVNTPPNTITQQF